MNRVLANRLKEIEKGVKDPWTFHEVSVIKLIQGKREESLDWLEKAADAGWKDFRFARRDPWFENLHSDPGFNEIMKKISLSLSKMKIEYEKPE